MSSFFYFWIVVLDNNILITRTKVIDLERKFSIESSIIKENLLLYFFRYKKNSVATPTINNTITTATTMMITVFEAFLLPGTLGVAVPLKLSLMISQITWIYILFYFIIFLFEHNLLRQAGCHMADCFERCSLKQW
jgi:hypothetical protein